MKPFLLVALCLSSIAVFAEEQRMEIIDLRQVPLADAARILSESSGLNVVASVEAGKTPVSLYLSNVELHAAIEALCRSHNLWFRDDEKSGIIRIHTPAEYQRDLSSFQEELTEVFDLRFPNATDLGRTIRELYGNRVRMNQDTTQQDMQTTNELEQRFERFDIVDGRSQQLGVIMNNGGGGFAGGGYRNNSNSLGGYSQSSRNQFSNSGFQGGYQNLSSRFYSNQTQEPQRIKGLTNEEIQSLQVSAAEERTAAAQKLLDERADIFVTIIQRLNKVIVRTSDVRAMKQIKALMTSVDVPTRTVLLEVKILRVSLNQGFSSAVDYLFSDGTTTVAFGSSNLSNNGGNDGTPTNGIGSNTLSNSGDLSFRYASGNFSAHLQVLEQKGQVRVVSTPTLLIANNEVSRLFIGEERPLNRSFGGGTVVPGAANNVVVNGGTDIEFRPVGTTLLVTPNINSDNTVTLRLLQENSNINVNGASVLVPSTNGFRQQTVDTVQSRTVSGTVVAKDQVPVVIGGLIDTGFTNTRSQVPILGNIPLIGALFGKRDKSKTRDELILIIRPHLVDPPEGGARASRELLDANHVLVNDAVRTENGVRQELDKALPSPVIPRAVPVDDEAPSKNRATDVVRPAGNPARPKQTNKNTP